MCYKEKKVAVLGRNKPTKITRTAPNGSPITDIQHPGSFLLVSFASRLPGRNL